MARGTPVSLADAVGPNFSAGFAGGGGELLRVLVVGVDDCHTRCRIDGAVEHEALGGVVLFHGAVVVEVIAREVGENRNVETDAHCAALIEAVTRDFGDEFGGSAGDAFGHQFEEIARFRSGVDRLSSLSRYVIFDGADEDCLSVGGVQKRFAEKCGGRFTVGAGDSSGGELFFGMAEKSGRSFGECAAAMFDFENGRLGIVDE